MCKQLSPDICNSNVKIANFILLKVLNYLRLLLLYLSEDQIMGNFCELLMDYYYIYSLYDYSVTTLCIFDAASNYN